MMLGQRACTTDSRGTSRSLMGSCAYSYSSTGSAFGWAIGATATDPPPYEFDCRARMPTFLPQTPANKGKRKGRREEEIPRRARRTIDRTLLLSRCAGGGLGGGRAEGGAGGGRWSRSCYQMAGEEARGERTKMADDDYFGGFLGGRKTASDRVRSRGVGPLRAPLSGVSAAFPLPPYPLL